MPWSQTCRKKKLQMVGMPIQTVMRRWITKSSLPCCSARDSFDELKAFDQADVDGGGQIDEELRQFCCGRAIDDGAGNSSGAEKLNFDGDGQVGYDKFMPMKKRAGIKMRMKNAESSSAPQSFKGERELLH